MKKALKKILPLCLCAALLFGLASCREVAEKPFQDINFIPDYADVKEETAGYILMEVQGYTLEQVIQFYELAILYAGSQQLARDDTQDGYWSYTGTYGEGRTLRITLRDTGEQIQILVGYLEEMQGP